MPEVEFLGLEDEQDAPRARAAARAARSIDTRRLITPLLWTIAAGLCVIAPFGTIYSIDIDNALGAQSIDGWGRITTRGVQTAFGHGPRYGIAFVVVAAGLVAAAALALGARTRGAQVGRVFALISAGILSGVLGLLFLEYRNEIDLVDANRNADSTSVSIGIGALFWWGLGALAAMVTGLIAWRPPRDVPAPETPPELHAEDESLTT